MRTFSKSLQAEELIRAHRLAPARTVDHIEYLKNIITLFDVELLRCLQETGYDDWLRMLKTLHSIELLGGAMLFGEVGDDMSYFGSTTMKARQAGKRTAPTLRIAAKATSSAVF